MFPENHLKGHRLIVYIQTHIDTMAKTSKTATDSAVSPAPAAAAPAKVEAKAAPKAAAKAAAAPAPAAAPAKVEAKVEAAAPAVEAEASVSSSYTAILTQLQSVQSTIASLRAQVRELEKQHARELRTANKANKRRKPATDRTPSGFRKPTTISDELAAFLGKPVGSVLSRTDVTREINAYIREHKLQDSGNGRNINPDAKLKKLLKLKAGEELTYFNLQRYMSPHFAKSVPAAAAQ